MVLNEWMPLSIQPKPMLAASEDIIAHPSAPPRILYPVSAFCSHDVRYAMQPSHKRPGRLALCTAGLVPARNRWSLSEGGRTPMRLEDQARGMRKRRREK